MKLIFSLFVFLQFSFSANANIKIAVIDSGTDYQHDDLASRMWMNPNEVDGNAFDDDFNGYPDDIYGWNFAEDNRKVIEYSYLGTLNDDIRRFLSIQTKSLRGQASEEEISWMRKIIADPVFLKRMQIYGNFAHGSHVTGITLGQSEGLVAMSLKIIPTEVKLPGTQKKMKSGLRLKFLKSQLKALAQAQMKTLKDVAKYIHIKGAHIANGSFGTDYGTMSKIIKPIYKGLMGKKASEEGFTEIMDFFFNELLTQGKEMVEMSPKTLFVFAAGNSRGNNDILPISPANVSADNSMTVAATLKNGALASFSNYGQKTVDLAAPGVGIRSTVPGSQYVLMSGTSQAAPYVAHIAAEVKKANISLTPVMIKEILMKTVDFKESLKLKTIAGGMANKVRAMRAAALSKTMTLKEAVSRARTEVLDAVYKSTKGQRVHAAHPEAHLFVASLPRH